MLHVAWADWRTICAGFVELNRLWAVAGYDDIVWWENDNGDGSSWSKNIVDGDFTGAGSVYAADVDNDGDLDILGAAMSANEITWWENKPVIAGDFKLDDNVDFEDFAIFALHWLETGCGPCTCDGADLTCDGSVDANDLREFSDNWLAGK